jgi:glycosyltransferase involved in cell wall biosynthesis
VRLAVVVSFLDEERYLPELLASLDAQRRPPDELLLVDDGSSDHSAELAEEYAATRPHVRALRRPPRARERDRLATAAELKAFAWGLERLAGPWDVVAKLDADLRLRPEHFAEIERAFEADPRLGVAGAYLATPGPSGAVAREPHPPDHVRGPNKFYRRACFEQIAPLPPFLGWDTIDELRARMHGWRTASVALPGGDSVHLRPTSTLDGVLRGQRRWGECAWGSGASPAYVAGVSVARMARAPYVLGGVSRAIGFGLAAARRRPRIERDVRAFRRREDRRRVARLLRGR